jgi:hypothetical protein
LLESQELPPGANLRGILAAAREDRIAAGWDCGEVGFACSGFNCTRDGVRLYVGIRTADPSLPTYGQLPSQGSRKE